MLHPVSGPGEDLNYQCPDCGGRWHRLHPVSGPGEDLNATVDLAASTKACCTRSPDRVRISTGQPSWVVGRMSSLHPVSGPGEDLNPAVDGQALRVLPAAPGLRTG